MEVWKDITGKLDLYKVELSEKNGEIRRRRVAENQDRWYSGQAPVSRLSDPGSIPTLTNVEKSFHLNDPRVMLNVGHLYRFRIVNSRWYRCTVVVYMSVIEKNA